MNKIALTLTALAATALSTAAPAAVTVVNTGPVITANSGTYSAKLTGTSGAFTDVISFFAPVGFNLQSADITSNYTGSNKKANIDFTSVLLNGVAFNIVSTGQSEIRSIFDQPLLAGWNTITVTGNAGVGAKLADAAFSGTLSFGNAVPEPATWALMLLGIGGIGAGMRRRNVSALRFA